MAISFFDNPTISSNTFVFELHPTANNNDDSSNDTPAAWNLLQKLSRSDFVVQGEEVPDPFLILSLAFNSDGTVLATSMNDYATILTKNPSGSNAGAYIPPNSWKYGYVQVFARDGAGQQFAAFGQALTGTRPLHAIGYSLDLDATGRTLATGSPNMACFFEGGEQFCGATSFPHAQIFDSATQTCAPKPQKFNNLDIVFQQY
jgi:hypothetical protein